MTNIIKELEKEIKKAGLTISDKKEEDCLYVISVPGGSKGEFLIYATKTTFERDKEECFRLHQIRGEHIPFETITIDTIQEYIDNYESYHMMRELPMFSFDSNNKEMFIPTYLDIVEKRGKHSRSYFEVLSIQEVIDRMEG